MPRLTLEALFVLRRTIDGAHLLSLSTANPMREECDDRSTSHPQQPDLLVLTANALESSQFPRATRAWLRQEGIPVVVYK